MFKKYIRNIVKEQIDDIRLENTLKQSGSKTYWEEHFKAQLKHTESLVKGRDKEISILKESFENLYGKLILKSNLLYESKQENEKLKKELLDSKNGLNGANDVIKNMKQENEKLKDKLYNIKGIIHVQHNRTYTNDNLMRTIRLIEDNLKES